MSPLLLVPVEDTNYPVLSHRVTSVSSSGVRSLLCQKYQGETAMLAQTEDMYDSRELM